MAGARQQVQGNKGTSASPSASWSGSTPSGAFQVAVVIANIDAGAVTISAVTAGWVAQGSAVTIASGVTARAFVRQNAASTSGAETFSLTASRPWAVFIGCYTGLETASAVDFFLSNQGNTANPRTGPSPEFVQDNEAVIAVLANQFQNTQSGWGVAWDQASAQQNSAPTTNSQKLNAAYYDRFVTNRTAVELSATLATSRRWVALMLAVKVASDAAPPAVTSTRYPEMALTLFTSEGSYTTRSLGSPRWGSVMPGGWADAQFVCDKAEVEANPQFFRYGAIATLKIASGTYAGEVIWEGYIRQPLPEPSGRYRVHGQPFKSLLEERSAPLLWQTRFIGDWQSLDDDVFLSLENDDSISIQVNAGSIVFEVPAETEVAQGDKGGIGWWQDKPPDGPVIRRVAGKIVTKKPVPSNAGSPLWTFQFRRYNGPLEPNPVVVATYASEIAAAGEDSFDTTLGSPQSMVGFSLVRVGGGTQATTVGWSIRLKNLRLNDLTSPVDADTYTGRQIISDLAAIDGNFTVGSMVATTLDGGGSLPNVLPFWWTGSDHWSLVEYLGTLHAFKTALWERTGGTGKPQLEWRPWSDGTEWTAYAYGPLAYAWAEIVPAEDAYSIVDVAYNLTIGGRTRHYRKPVVDPNTGQNPLAQLPGITRERTFRIDIQDPLPPPTTPGQFHPALVTNVGNLQAAEFGQDRFSGWIELGSVSDAGVTKPGWMVRAGDTVTIPDKPGGSVTLRIYETDQSPERSRFRVGRIPLRLDRLLAMADLKRRRAGKEASAL